MFIGKPGSFNTNPILVSNPQHFCDLTLLFDLDQPRFDLVAQLHSGTNLRDRIRPLCRWVQARSQLNTTQSLYFCSDFSNHLLKISMRPHVACPRTRRRVIKFVPCIVHSGFKFLNGLGGRNRRNKTTQQDEKYEAENQMFLSHYFTPCRCKVSSVEMRYASSTVCPCL